MQILLLTYLLTYLLIYMVSWAHPSPHPNRTSIGSAVSLRLTNVSNRYTHVHARAHACTHTHRQTDHGTSVTVGHILMLCTGCDVIIMNASVLCKIDKKSLRCANNGILFTQNNHYAVILMYVQISIVFKCFLAKSLRFKLNRYYWNSSHSM